jgi:glycosyltransferase involved in cell wall biosynthesis
VIAVLAERRVLLVSYFFPPVGGGGMLRALKLAKYLPVAGWEPEVLGADDPRYHLRDDAALGEVDCPVHRAPARRHPSLARMLGLVSEGGGRASSSSVGGVRGAGLRGRLRTFFARLGDLPDQQVGWSRAARSLALKLARQGRYCAVWTTSPPASAHLVGLTLKRELGLTWVADLRDSWTLGPFFRPPTSFHRLLQRRWEGEVIAETDAVVCATPRMGEFYRRAYPSQADKVGVIINGYDEEDFLGSDRLEPYPGAVIGHAGTFYGARRPDAFLTALETVAAERPGAGLRFVEAGTSGLEAEDALNGFVRRRPDLITRLGNLPHRRALEEMARCRLLLLVVGNQPGSETVLTGKLFEYLRLGRPILACCPPGDAADLVRSLGAGSLADPDDAPGIAAALRRLLDDPPEPPRRERITTYERSRLAGEMAALFERLRA